MPRTASKSPSTSEPERSDLVVRMSMAIPALDRLSIMPETFEPSRALPCSGRCGHCDVHPCKLHVPA